MQMAGVKQPAAARCSTATGEAARASTQGSRSPECSKMGRLEVKAVVVEDAVAEAQQVVVG